MNSSNFLDLFEYIIGSYTGYPSAIDYTQNKLIETGSELLNSSLFNVNTLGSIDIPFVCACFTFLVFFYFFIALLRVVFSR